MFSNFQYSANMNATEHSGFQELEITMGRRTAAAKMGIRIPFGVSLKNHLSTSGKLSGIALLFLSLTSHSSPHLRAASSQVQPEIIKPSDSLSTAWPVEKSLKLYCYHHCVSWRQAVVCWRWVGANFHWAEDSSVRPLLAVHKQEQTPCVCLHACAHAGGRECMCVYLQTLTDVGGKATFVFQSDTRSIPEVKQQQKKQ